MLYLDLHNLILTQSMEFVKGFLRLTVDSLSYSSVFLPRDTFSGISYLRYDANKKRYFRAYALEI